MIKQNREVLTPDQAADYLQVNRETIYRYIREGKLVASKLGRTYRVPKRSLELLLWATRTREDITFASIPAKRSPALWRMINWTTKPRR